MTHWQPEMHRDYYATIYMTPLAQEFAITLFIDVMGHFVL